MTIKLLFMLLVSTGCVMPCLAQDSYTTVDKLVALPGKFVGKVNNRITALESNLEKRAEKYLAKLKKREARLRKKLLIKDSAAAKMIFADADKPYNELEQRLKIPQRYKDYIPYLDTLTTALQFAEKYSLVSNALGNSNNVLSAAFSNIKGLEAQLQKAEIIKQFLKDRKQFLRNQLYQYGLGRELQKLNKDVYYYSQYINEYKTILQDPQKLERKVIEVLSKTTAFQDFLRKNSFLASIFRVPDDPGGTAYQANIAGLQTRAQVTQLMQQQFGNTGPSGMQAFQQNIQQAQSQLQNLKDKIANFGGSPDDVDMPNFIPNRQKVKSFLQRLEFGTNIQTQRAGFYFPATSDIGMSLGYKLNDKSIIGVGMSYSLGLGSGWRDIQLSSEGMGFRSFVDWRLKGSFWMSGGYEMNYRSAFSTIDQLKELSSWQQSGLLGITKVISLRDKLLKKTKLSILWDFLSYRQMPHTPALKFRIGYNFK